MDTQQQLNELLTWEKVYQWAKEHTLAPYIAQSKLYQHITNALGRSKNALMCPLGCYLNEAFPTANPWLVLAYTVITQEWTEENEVPYNLYYDMPLWAVQVIQRVDEQYNGQDWVTQEQFLAILEVVAPREENHER